MPCFELHHDVPLGPRTTLQLGGPARHLAPVKTHQAMLAALEWANARGVAVRILGGGSNIIVADDGFDGLVVDVRLRGIEQHRVGSDVFVTAQAGEPWDDFVQYTVAQNWAGLECLSGIPGRVGATPIQNVGAYGQEVSERIARVDVLDRHTMQRSSLQPTDCDFGYRDSFFKRNPERYVVLAVTFRLSPGAQSNVRYAELARAVDATATLADVRAAVLALRRRKSMVIDPQDPNHRSAGSFFTNPIVDQPRLAHVTRRALDAGHIASPEALPHWPVDGGTKLAAGWLIEHAGIARGLRRGGVGVSTNHALCLVNRGQGTTRELMALADEIQQAVRTTFGVELVPEPVQW